MKCRRNSFLVLFLWNLAFTHAFVPQNHKNSQFGLRYRFELSANKKIKINYNISGDISSDGLLAGRKQEQKEQAAARASIKSNLGVSTKKKTTSSAKANKPLSNKSEKLAQQRNGNVDSRLQAGLSVPEDQPVQIQELTRGNKKVTILRGLTSTMDDRKKLLKELKAMVGGGGAMIEGVIEIQGAHSDRILDFMTKKGYSKAKVVK